MLDMNKHEFMFSLVSRRIVLCLLLGSLGTESSVEDDVILGPALAGHRTKSWAGGGGGRGAQPRLPHSTAQHTRTQLNISK